MLGISFFKVSCFNKAFFSLSYWFVLEVIFSIKILLSVLKNILSSPAFKQTKKELKAGGGIEAPLYATRAEQGKYGLASHATAAVTATGSPQGSKREDCSLKETAQKTRICLSEISCYGSTLF